MLKERKERHAEEELPKGKIVFDAGIIIEQLLSTSRGEIIKEAILNEEILPYVSHITLTEALYILCRHIGWNLANNKVANLIESGYFIVEDLEHVFGISAQYKCERKISLADCFTLGLAKYISAPALFAVKEKELTNESKKKPFDVKIIFLEDLL
ncbi:MAG: PIN domain-containing protein [Candidatus Jordarchaeum sp.]|uniref:PIN domain-containing protein n=1 Tax=Candidatus Jordarchaeum sp. TaxID=2823881 RepID=UPI0040492CE9